MDLGSQKIHIRDELICFEELKATNFYCSLKRISNEYGKYDFRSTLFITLAIKKNTCGYFLLLKGEFDIVENAKSAFKRKSQSFEKVPS